MGFLIECDERVFGRAGEVGGAEEGEDDVGGDGDGEIWLGGGEEAGDAVAEGGVVVDYAGRGAGDVEGGAAGVCGCIAGGAEEAVGADAAAFLVDDDAGAAVGTGEGGFAVGDVWGIVLMVAGDDNECDGYYDCGGDEEKEYYH